MSSWALSSLYIHQVYISLYSFLGSYLGFRLTRLAGEERFIFAGDFNSRQNMSPYYMLHNGQLSAQLQKELSLVSTASQDDKRLFQIFSNCYEHHQNDLTSSYLSVKVLFARFFLICHENCSNRVGSLTLFLSFKVT